jgi:NAD(P)-dependent dehydrogenase (short-subunit alcohol dehydrogenase family)
MSHANLDGKVVAIAGAAGGLGPDVAKLLARRGATLALGERDGDRLDQVVADLDLPEDKVDKRVVDLLSLDDARAWADSIRERFGKVDALVHLVGGWRGGKPIGEAPLEDDAFLHDVLVRTVQLATRAFLPALADSAGRFVIISSPQADGPSSDNAAYGSAKAAAEAWTLAYADELAQHGGTANIIRVNAIVTPAMRSDSPDKEFRTFTDTAEIAQAVHLLLSEAGRKMNGQRLSLHP